MDTPFRLSVKETHAHTHTMNIQMNEIHKPQILVSKESAHAYEGGLFNTFLGRPRGRGVEAGEGETDEEEMEERDFLLPTTGVLFGDEAEGLPFTSESPSSLRESRLRLASR